MEGAMQRYEAYKKRLDDNYRKRKVTQHKGNKPSEKLQQLANTNFSDDEFKLEISYNSSSKVETSLLMENK